MQVQEIIQIAGVGVETALIVSAPVLLLGLTAGLAVSIFQAATQVNDAALAFIPKILATVFALVYFGSWMMSKMASYATYALTQIPMVAS